MVEINLGVNEGHSLYCSRLWIRHISFHIGNFRNHY